MGYLDFLKELMLLQAALIGVYFVGKALFVAVMDAVKE